MYDVLHLCPVGEYLSGKVFRGLPIIHGQKGLAQRVWTVNVSPSVDGRLLFHQRHEGWCSRSLESSLSLHRSMTGINRGVVDLAREGFGTPEGVFSTFNERLETSAGSLGIPSRRIDTEITDHGRLVFGPVSRSLGRGLPTTETSS